MALGLLDSGGVPDPAAPNAGLGLLAEAKPAPFKEGFGAGVSGVKSNLFGAAALVAHGVGATGAEDKLLVRSAENAQEAGTHSRKIEDVDWTSPASITNHIKYLAGNAIPSLVTMAIGGGVGRGLGAVAGLGGKALNRATMVGAVTPDMALESGGIYPEALKTQREHPEAGVESPALRAVVGGALATGIDFMPLLAAEKYLTAAGKGGFGAMAKGAAKGAPVGAALEGTQEAIQSVIERASAGQSLTDAEAVSDYVNNFAGGAVLGAGFGAVIGGHRGSAAAPAVVPAQIPTGPVETPIAPNVSPVDTNPLQPVANTEEMQQVAAQPPLALLPKDEPLALVPKTTPLEDAWTAHNALEEQHSAATSALDKATQRLAALDEEAKKPGAKKRDITLETRAARSAQAEAKAAVADLTPKLEAAKSTIKTQEILANTAEGINPAINTSKGIAPDSDIIQTKPPTDQEQAAKAVAGVHAMFREQGMPLETTKDSLATPPKTAREAKLEIVNQRAARTVDKAVDEKTRQGAVETAAVQAAQPEIEELGAAAKLSTRTIAVLKNALVSIAREAAAKPTTAEAQQHIGVEVPKVLKGQVKAVDAAKLAALMINAVSDAHTLYSKGAVEYTGPRYASVKSLDEFSFAVVDSAGERLGTYPTRELADRVAASHSKRWMKEYLKQQKKEQKPQQSVAALTSDQFFALPEPAQHAAVDEFDRIMAAKGQQLVSRLEGIIGKRAGLSVSTFTAAPGSPIGSYTRVSQHKSIISMALNAKNGLSIADHEGFHAAEDLVLDPRERQVVRNAFTPGSRMFKLLNDRVMAYDRENKTHLADEIAGIPAEARAYGFEFWRRGELQADGVLARAFEKIKQFFDRVANMVKGLGFQSYADIFTALDRGQFADREQSQGEAAGTSRSEAGVEKQTDTPAFKKWFGDSKVVDAEGKPLVVYHGTAADFTQFAMKGRAYPGAGPEYKTPNGIAWFSPDTHNASWVAENLSAKKGEIGAPNVMPVYLALRNPLVLTDATKFNFDLGAAYPTARDISRIKARGHDGFMVSETGKAPDASAIVAFKDTAIKSAIGNNGAFDGTNPNILYSKAAADMTREARAGELQQAQLFDQFNRIQDNAKLPDELGKAAMGAVWSETGGNISRWFKKNILTPNFISRSSEGYKNVYKTLNTYGRYKSVLVERMLKEQMPSWYDASQTDREVSFDALLKRTTEGYSKASTQLTELLAPLTPPQRALFDQAMKMMEGFLRKELEVDVAMYERNIADKEEAAKLVADRISQVDSLIDTGYIPLQRYGDHTVHVYKDAVKEDGTPYKQTAGLLFFDRSSQAEITARMYNDEIARSGAELKVEVGTHYKAARDTTISVQQFLDTARRNGVPLTSAERERIVKSLSQADSLMRNRLMRRKTVPGYSKDGMRVLHEFGVRTAGKIAYAKFAPAIDAAADGRPVESDIVGGEPIIQTSQVLDDASNLWKKDGNLDGFTHSLADKLVDYVLVPDHTGGWSRKLRGAAMVYFIGGSLSGGIVNAMSVPMMVVPELSIHTNYANAMATTLGSWKTAWRHQGILRDVAKLRDDKAFPIKEIDDVPGLRAAMVEAADRLLDTEIHQITGIAQGSLYSQSRGVQKSMEAWMAPFRISEQTNRITAFMAAYKVGQENGLTSQALYRFAGEAVDATQNNYNEANRPGAARNPIFALMFMFKSFPLFMTEAIVLMYKANPKSAVYMLLGLTAMTGVQGLPFAETLEDLIDTIAQRLFGSPFNTRRAMRNMVKSASEAVIGYDLSDIVLRGLVNEMTGLSVSSRVGAGDFVPGSRLGTADADQGKVLEGMLGAPYAMMKDTIENAGKLVGGALTGDWKQAVDALRNGGPVAVRNAIKGAQQLSDGYASDAGGKKLVDISGPSAVFQTIGMSSAGLAKAYELDKMDKQTNAFYQQVSHDMTNQLVRALRDGDTDKVQTLMEARNAWNTANPDMPLMANPASIRRDIALAGMPLNARTLRMLPRQLRGTSTAAEGIGAGQ